MPAAAMPVMSPAVVQGVRHEMPVLPERSP